MEGRRPGAVRLQGRCRPPVGRGTPRTPRRRLGQLAVPVVPVRRAPAGSVELQRVRDDLLQGAGTGADRVRRALLPRATRAGRRVLRARRVADRTVLPAPPSRPHALRRYRRRRAHLQPPSLAVRSRDGPVPHERRPPPALRARGRLVAVERVQPRRPVRDRPRSLEAVLLRPARLHARARDPAARRRFGASSCRSRRRSR